MISFARLTAVIALAAAPAAFIGAGTRASAERASVPAETVVAVSGMVRFGGTPPAPTPVDMGGDAYCTEANGGQAPMTSPVKVAAGGGLANVIVHVKAGAPSGKAAAAGSAEAVVLDQVACAYDPHVVALRTGQTLIIRNSDATLHNVRVTPEKNQGFNIGQPVKGIEAKRVFRSPEVGIHVICNVHGWMSGVIAVFDHPYYAVTAEDGSFSLDELPPGEYTLEAWHETLGTQTQMLTIAAGGAGAVEFTFR
jgi:plastocyanin